MGRRPEDVVSGDPERRVEELLHAALDEVLGQVVVGFDHRHLGALGALHDEGPDRKARLHAVGRLALDRIEVGVDATTAELAADIAVAGVLPCARPDVPGGVCHRDPGHRLPARAGLVGQRGHEAEQRQQDGGGQQASAHATPVRRDT